MAEEKSFCVNAVSETTPRGDTEFSLGNISLFYQVLTVCSSVHPVQDVKL